MSLCLDTWGNPILFYDTKIQLTDFLTYLTLSTNCEFIKIWDTIHTFFMCDYSCRCVTKRETNKF